jgi:type I restriction enzyme S subunit
MNKIEIKISHPPEWPTKTIYEACQIVSRGTAPVYVENSTVLAIGQRCVREFGLQPEEARFHDQRSMTRVLKACKRDVLLNSTGTGTIGRSCIFNADGTYIIDGHVTLLRSDPDQLDGRWLNALLQSPQGQLHLETQCYSGSTNQVELSRERLSATSIPLPSLPEQRRIAEIFDTIDEAIQKTEALISKLKAMKQGLLHDLLTRGLDKNGKLRDPKAYPEQFTDSQIGCIPITWSIEKLGSLAFVTKLAGFEYTKYFDYSITGEIIAVRVLNIRNGELDLSDIHAIPRATSKLLPRSALEKGDLVLSYVGTIGEAAIVREDDRFHLAPNVAKITPNKEFFLPDFLLYQILSQSGQKRLFDLATLTSQPAISMARIRMFLTLVPSLSEQESICGIIGAHDARIRTEEQYRDKLKLQKKGLMHDLLTGKVRAKSKNNLSCVKKYMIG